ncbi:MAG: FAD-dependent oxidoreductase [Deltaproteobacteria bacterium]|nr:FAD-dependent oxidoreductase [Deltaproteobacteria bacterium]
MSEKEKLKNMDPNRNAHEKLSFSGISDLPDIVISTGHMTWNETGTWRYMKPRYRNLVSPCVVGCPNGQDVEAWIRLISEGRYDEALEKNMEESPIPGVCGRACFHPCEKSCNRAQFDRSVSINNLERFLSDHGTRKVPKVAAATAKSVAVVGSGPAGLACAYHLRRMGHAVTIYEAAKEPGGVLRYGIPDYRLPRDMLAEEIDVLKKMGVEIQCGVRVGTDVTWKDMERFDRVFLGTGVHVSRALGISGEDAQGVMSGLNLLKKVASGEDVELGERVLVIGGGNTAIDAARTAMRLDAKVTILYRRSREEMPAHDDEVTAAEAEGVVFQMLAAPSKVVTENNRVRALECVKVKLGQPDESGRRRPIVIEGSNFTVPCDTVVTAVGELADFSFLPDGLKVENGAIVVDDSLKTSNERYFAGGDVVEQPHTIVNALAAGKRAAIGIDCSLRGGSFEEALANITLATGPALSMRQYLAYREHKKIEEKVPVVNEICEYETLNMDYFEQSERVRKAVVGLTERMQTMPASAPNRFKEVELGLTEEQAAKAADRCFHCGRCIECDNCYIFCPDASVMPKTDEFGYAIDDYHCKGCGVCVHECPRNAMEMVRE